MSATEFTNPIYEKIYKWSCQKCDGELDQAHIQELWSKHEKIEEEQWKDEEQPDHKERLEALKRLQLCIMRPWEAVEDVEKEATEALDGVKKYNDTFWQRIEFAEQPEFKPGIIQPKKLHETTTTGERLPWFFVLVFQALDWKIPRSVIEENIPSNDRDTMLDMLSDAYICTLCCFYSDISIEGGSGET